jgi:hypothetical protein
MDSEVSELRYIPDPGQIKTEAENYAFNFDKEDKDNLVLALTKGEKSNDYPVIYVKCLLHVLAANTWIQDSDKKLNVKINNKIALTYDNLIAYLKAAKERENLERSEDEINELIKQIETLKIKWNYQQYAAILKDDSSKNAGRKKKATQNLDVFNYYKTYENFKNLLFLDKVNGDDNHLRQLQSQIDKNTKDGNQTNPKYIQLLKDVGTGTFRRDESADYSELSQLLAENIKQLRDNYKRVHRYTMSMPKGDAIKILGDFARANRAVAEIAETHSGKEAVQTASIISPDYNELGKRSVF